MASKTEPRMLNIFGLYTDKYGHRLGGVRQPTLCFDEYWQFFGFVRDPLLTQKPAVYAQTALFHLRENEAQLTFEGDIRESYAYELWNRTGDIRIARLGSACVLTLLNQGLIDEDGELTEKGSQTLPSL